MRQFFILFGVFICSSVLADHDSSQGYNYNGRTFKCHNFREAKVFAETAKEEEKGRFLYLLARCELHRGHLFPGITTLKQAADKGEHLASFQLTEYYSSGGYNLPKGQATGNEADLQKTIEYEELTLKFIRSMSNYPFGSNYGDDENIEKEHHLYLKTASNLTGSYMGLFATRFTSHIESKNTDIGGATLEPLRNAIEAANRCFSIPYNSNVWSKRVYNNTINLCRENKEIAEALLPLENDRLRVARLNCQNTRLSKCAAHNEIDRQIEQLYNEYLDKTAQLLAAL